MKKLSKPFYLIPIVIGYFVGGGMLIASIAMMNQREEEMGIFLLFVGLALMLYALVLYLVLIYKMWKSIQGGSARTTPGKAVGFLFIPLFNFYWIFQALWGWTKDFNQHTAERNLTAPRMPEGLALTICILALVGIIPFVGYVTGFINAILIIVLFNKAIDCVNSLVA